MWDFLFLAFFGLFCIIVQSNPVMNHCLFPVKPDFTIPLALYISFARRPVGGCILVLWIGFLMDLFSGGVVGLFLLLRMFLFFLIQLLKKFFFLENPMPWIFLVLLFFLMDSFLIHLFFKAVWGWSEELVNLLKPPLVQGVVTLFLSFLIFPLFSALERSVKKSSTS